MNIAEKMAIESRLMTRIADWMHQHGEVLFDKQRSNAYTGFGLGRSVGGDTPSGSSMWTG